MKTTIKFTKVLGILILILQQAFAQVACPIDAINFDEYKLMETGKEYCLSKDLEINSLNIPSGAKLTLLPGIKLTVTGGTHQVYGDLKLHDFASIEIRGSLSHGNRKNSEITLGKGAYLSITGSWVAFNGKINLSDFAIVQICATFTNHSSGAYVNYIGENDYDAYFINKASVSGNGYNILSESPEVIWITTDGVAHLSSGQAKHSGAYGNESYKYWPNGLSSDWNNCQKIEIIYENRPDFLRPNFKPLPITLESFIAREKDSSILLEWETAKEEYNQGFAIQRSGDGKTWEDISFVNSKSENGNSNYKLHYRFVDSNPYNGKNYYRLKQMDFNGDFEYSQVRQIVFVNASEKLSIYPNPAKSYIIINGLIESTKLYIINQNGQVVYSQKVDIGNKRIDLSQFATGMYTVIVENDNGTRQNKKILITK